MSIGDFADIPIDEPFPVPFPHVDVNHLDKAVNIDGAPEPEVFESRSQVSVHHNEGIVQLQVIDENAPGVIDHAIINLRPEFARRVAIKLLKAAEEADHFNHQGDS